MSTLLLTALALAPAPPADVIPQAWTPSRVARVSVVAREVDEEQDGETATEHAFSYDLRVDASAAGTLVRREDLEVTRLHDRELDEESRESFAEMLTLWSNQPALVVDESGTCTGYEGIEDAVRAVLREWRQDSDLPPAALRARVDSPPARANWLGPNRRAWFALGEQWAGVPTAPGTYTREGRVYVGGIRKELYDVELEYVVSEPEERDGRTVVTVVRTARLGDGTVTRKYMSDFLRALDAFPSDVRYAMRVRTKFTTTALFDAETWLPLSVDDRVVTRIRMQTPRSLWRETYSELVRFELDWSEPDLPVVTLPESARPQPDEDDEDDEDASEG